MSPGIEKKKTKPKKGVSLHRTLRTVVINARDGQSYNIIEMVIISINSHDYHDYCVHSV